MNSFGKLILSAATIAAICLAMMGGCPLAADGPPSDVRFVNMATTDQMNPSRAVLDGIDFGSVGRYNPSLFQVVNSGSKSMSITDSIAATVYSNGSEDIPSDHTVNLVSVGNSVTSVDLVKVGEDKSMSMPGAGEVRIHFINGCDSFAVDIYILPVGTPIAGSPWVSNLAYRGDTVLSEAITGPHDFVMCPAGTTTEAARSTVDLIGGKVFLSTVISPSVASSPKKSSADFKTFDFHQTAF